MPRVLVEGSDGVRMLAMRPDTSARVLLLLSSAALPGVCAQDSSGVAAISILSLLFLLCSCVAICACSGIGCFVACDAIKPLRH